MSEPLGASLEEFCRTASTEVLWVAPFIKVGALMRLLESVPPNVVLRCVTRWRPDEIAAGVCDLEIWPILRERDAQLWLCPHLHAKYFRANEQCLVGSANLTGAALGWSHAANLELLVKLSAAHPTLQSFEATLWESVTPVDDGIYEAMQAAVAALPKVLASPLLTPESTPEFDCIFAPDLATAWLPQTRHPEDLFHAYAGQNESLSSATRETAERDLTWLQVPPNLSREAFENYVGTLLLQAPLVRRIDEFVATSQRFGAVRDFLKTLPCAAASEFDADRVWQTLMRWLLQFLPQRYTLSIPNYSEVFCRVR
jgi:hypothetical protein